MLIGFRGLVIQTGRERLRKESGLKLNEKSNPLLRVVFFMFITLGISDTLSCESVNG